MALIFQRLARNFIKNGYFPTDEVTLARIISALEIGAPRMRILDPCCGEGTALAEIENSFKMQLGNVNSLGVEFDAERAWHAKQILSQVLHSDIQDVVISPRSVGLLFLNPPYGDVVADRAQLGEATKRERLEKVFFRKTISTLQFGGVMVLIVPFKVIDPEFAAMIARNFDRVRFYMAPETRFKQCVIFGIKRRVESPAKGVTEMLERGGRGELLENVLPEHWIDEPYLVPGIDFDADLNFYSVRIDAPQLKVELSRYARQTLWPQFEATFAQAQKPPRPPLRDMSRWHLALALAAGQVSGIVRSADGRTLLIKGNTFKEKAVTNETQVSDKGVVTEIRTMTDTFVPIIRAIDFTPGPNLGQVLTIR